MDKSRITEFHKTEPTYDFYKLFVWNNGLYGFTSVLEKSKLIRLLGITSEQITESVFNYNNGHFDGLDMMKYIDQVDEIYGPRNKSMLDLFGHPNFLYIEELMERYFANALILECDSLRTKLDKITEETEKLNKIFDRMFDEDPLRANLNKIKEESKNIRILFDRIVYNLSKL